MAAHTEESESSAEQAPRKKPRRPRRESVVCTFHRVQSCLSLMFVFRLLPHCLTATHNWNHFYVRPLV